MPCSTLTVCSEELHCWAKIHCSQINSRSRCYRFVRACRENVRILRCISIRNTQFMMLLHAPPVTAITLRNLIQHLGGWMSSTFWFWVSFGWITELKWQFYSWVFIGINQSGAAAAQQVELHVHSSQGWLFTDSSQMVLEQDVSRLLRLTWTHAFLYKQVNRLKSGSWMFSVEEVPYAVW